MTGDGAAVRAVTRRRFLHASAFVPAALVLPSAFSSAQPPGQTARSSLRYTVAAGRSEVRYRVREQLVGLNFPNDAVAATRVLIRDSRFAVDLRELRSDQPRRDNYVRRNTLETDRYPTVVFVPTELRGLAVPLPSSGTAALELVGDLTVREATRRVTWAATAAFTGRDVSIRARTAFRFEDFGLRVPRVSVVLGVEDDIRLEADLLLRRAP